MELDFENIYCVGRRTKRLIEKRIGKVTQVENSSEKLANYLVSNLKDDAITFFCGNKRRDELPTVLAESNIIVNEIETYQTQLTPRKIEEKFKAILFYSPSGIESYLKENKAKIESVEVQIDKRLKLMYNGKQLLKETMIISKF